MDNASQTNILKVGDTSISTSYLKAPQPRRDNLTIVLLHGAGQASSQRFAPLAQIFADNGLNVIALDFVGHGKTGGEVSSNSLALRTEHAQAAIEHWTDSSIPLILGGSSMSGQTALRVSAQLGARVKSLWLLQPAIYAQEAEEVFFGPELTKILHQQGSWRSSPALQDAANFKGKALITIGAEDQVIPWGVIEELTKAFKHQTKELRLDVFGGVRHELPTWLPDQHKICRQLIDYLTDAT